MAEWSLCETLILYVEGLHLRSNQVFANSRLNSDFSELLFVVFSKVFAQQSFAFGFKNAQFSRHFQPAQKFKSFQYL